MDIEEELTSSLTPKKEAISTLRPMVPMRRRPKLVATRVRVGKGSRRECIHSRMTRNASEADSAKEVKSNVLPRIITQLMITPCWNMKNQQIHSMWFFNCEYTNFSDDWQLSMRWDEDLHRLQEQDRGFGWMISSAWHEERRWHKSGLEQQIDLTAMTRGRLQSG